MDTSTEHFTPEVLRFLTAEYDHNCCTGGRTMLGVVAVLEARPDEQKERGTRSR
jgi:hypothetical protein